MSFTEVLGGGEGGGGIREGMRPGSSEIPAGSDRRSVLSERDLGERGKWEERETSRKGRRCKNGFWSPIIPNLSNLTQCALCIGYL